MERYILQAVYRGAYSLFKIYYSSHVIVTKPLNIPSYTVKGEVISTITFEGAVKGSLILESDWEVVESITTRLAGYCPAGRDENTAGGNTEFINMLAGIVKRTYEHHNLSFNFSLPVTSWQGNKTLVYSAPHDEIYLYKVNFESFLCSLVLVLHEKKDYADDLK